VSNLSTPSEQIAKASTQHARSMQHCRCGNFVASIRRMKAATANSHALLSHVHLKPFPVSAGGSNAFTAFIRCCAARWWVLV